MSIVYLIIKYLRIASSIIAAIFTIISLAHIIYMTANSSWSWENIILTDDLFNYARPIPLMVLFLVVAFICYALEKTLHKYK